jgi:competence ComEA-like helix-hairpin-helix protein
MLRRLIEWLALTKTEQKVLAFLVGAMVLGMGIRLYRSTFPSTPNFDYRASDSTFAAMTAAIDTSASEEPAEEETGKINPNTATKRQLMKLPGIGEVTAERIMLYRDEVGPFQAIDELTRVRGISKKKLEQIKPFITLE